MNIVLILGGFLVMMSFSGTITSLMSESGLAESLETCYGKNTVKHMLTGKAIARAFRGHFLVEAVLEETFMRPFLMMNRNSSNTEVEGNDKVQTDRNNQNVIHDQTEIDEDAICGEQYDESVLKNEDTSWTEEILNKNKTTLRSLTAEEINEIMSLHDELKSNYQTGLNQLKRFFEFKQLCSVINVFKLELSNLSRTAKFWMQYSGYVKIPKEFIRGTRMGQ